MAPSPIPDNVNAVLTQLTPAQKVTLKTYIASLRSQIKELEDQIQTLHDPDPHAHYHGHEKCTVDHGTDAKKTEHDHSKGHDHHAHDHHKEHKEHHPHSHDDHHKEHHHDEHCHHEEEHAHDHHKDEPMAEENHDHEHSHEHSHEHKHIHDEKEGEIPAWKKRATAADPLAAPFGGDWKTETSLSATDAVAAGSKMEE